MKRQYIAFTANGQKNSGVKLNVAEATKWAQDLLGKEHCTVYICETIAVATRQPMPVIVTDIPKDDFDADKIQPKDVQPAGCALSEDFRAEVDAFINSGGREKPRFVKSTA